MFLLSEFSRLGRSMLECMEIISIATQKGIKIYTVKGNWQMDDTIQSKVMAMVFSMAAEIERDLISKRAKEALQTKKANGVKLGRPIGVGKSKLDKYKLRLKPFSVMVQLKNSLLRDITHLSRIFLIGCRKIN